MNVTFPLMHDVQSYLL